MGLFKRFFEFLRTLFRPRKEEKEKEPLVVQPVKPKETIKQRVFHNVIFRDPFRNPTLTHEIDRIIVRRNGIFCIEDKDWKGDIYGCENDRLWRQVMGDGSIVHSHLNPIAQNETHKDVLEEIIDSNENDYVIPISSWRRTILL